MSAPRAHFFLLFKGKLREEIVNNECFRDEKIIFDCEKSFSVCQKKSFTFFAFPRNIGTIRKSFYAVHLQKGMQYCVPIGGELQMIEWMKKFPGGIILIPMFISALLNTVLPNAASSLGGATEAVFGSRAINSYMGLISFFSAMSLNIKSAAHVLRKQGVLLFVKTTLCIGVCLFFARWRGLSGIFSISFLSVLCALCSTNPSLYLAIMQDYGSNEDKSAFSILGIFCTPIFPMLIYSLVGGVKIDPLPVISILLMVALGILFGNISKSFKNFCAPAAVILMPFFGFALGSGINLLEAFKACASGVLLTVIFYAVLLPALYFTETRILKEDGFSAVAMTSVAGISIAIPSFLAACDARASPYVSKAAAQITFATTLSSIITPLIIKKLAKKRGRI